MRIHEGPHDGTYAPACFGCKLRTVQFEGIAAAERRAEDKKFGADMAAYKRMREHGIQPKSIGGSAEVEAQANSSWEAEHHLIMSNPVRKEYLSRIEDAKAVS